MKYTKKIIVIFLAAVFLATFCAFEALAKFETTGDSPPYGLKIEGGNKGDKFEGVVDVEWYDRISEYPIQTRNSMHPCYDENNVAYDDCCLNYLNLLDPPNAVSAIARVTVRVRKGSQTYIVFVHHVAITDTEADDETIQAEIVAAIKCPLVKKIYGDGTDCDALTIGLKEVKDFGAVQPGFEDDIMGEAAPISADKVVDTEDAECHVLVGGSRKLLIDVVINIF